MITSAQTTTNSQIRPETDEAFRKLMPRLGKRAYAQLESSIMKEGCRDPLVAWEYEEKLILLDGYNRLAICTTHNIECEVVVKTTDDLPDRDAAMDWIDQNQLARRNLTARQFKMILGRLYNRQKQKQGGDRKSKRQNDASIRQAGKTSKRIGKQYGVSPRKVERAGKLVQAVEELKKQDPEIEDKIMRGEGPSETEVLKTARSSTQKKQGEEPVQDAAGRTIPEHLREVYARRSVIEDLLRDVRRIRDTVTKYLDDNDPLFRLLNPASFQRECKWLQEALESALPYAVCPSCEGADHDCKDCKGLGFVSERIHTELAEEAKQ